MAQNSSFLDEIDREGKGKQSLARAAQSGSEGDAVLFFHSPPPSVKHLLLPLHDQFNFLSGCAV